MVNGLEILIVLWYNARYLKLVKGEALNGPSIQPLVHSDSRALFKNRKVCKRRLQIVSIVCKLWAGVTYTACMSEV